QVLAIDMGGTKIALGIVENDMLLDKMEIKVPKETNKQALLSLFTDAIDQVIGSQITSIGIGVPGLVDKANGVIYDLLNVPSWSEVGLGEHLKTKYELPVYIDNDANCFALAEYYLGKHKVRELVGLALGTGLGAGIISNGRLVNGRSGGAGEFGMIPYLDHFIEYYACGQFFENVHGIKGDEVYAKAQRGDQHALSLYEELGHHVGHAMSIIRLAVDPGMIVLAGSVAKGFEYFKEAMWERLSKHPFPSATKSIEIKVSKLENAPLMGASCLCKP
ncbi:MAG: ROK family protein, partial [Cyclobacteriaceae bacterium]